MKKIFFTPGPSQLYPSVPLHIKNALKENIASISHRSKKFEEIFFHASSGIKKLLNIPESYHIFFVSSGTEAMERVIQNCVENNSYHFVNGSFSNRFFETAKELGKKPQKVEVSFGEGFDFKKINIPPETELICLTHNETSSGVMTPVAEITKLSKTNPNKLIAVDIVSSVPFVDLDYSLLDVVFFSVQKGFGLPAGLGVLIVSPRAIKKSQQLVNKGVSIGSYHSFLSLLQFAEKNQTPETPPVLEMYLLGKIIADMITIGIEKIRNQTEQKAKLIYNFFDSHSLFSPFVNDIQTRSQTVITVNVDTKQQEIRKYLEQKGYIVGTGYGKYKETQIRIANFPTHSLSDIKGLITKLKTKGK